MEQTVPALIIAAIMIAAGVLLADVTTDSVSTFSESWRQVEAIAEDRLGTDLSITNTAVGGGGAEITFDVLNNGRTPIDDFDDVDLIISYDGTDLNRYAVWLPFNEDVSQPDNTWQVTSFLNDYHNIGVLDMGERMSVRIKLNPPTDVGPDRWFVLATETGVSYTVYY
ncbi:MAG: hypothetical protein ACE5FA_06235 [Dehalococcoidia bacterium]